MIVLSSMKAFSSGIFIRERVDARRNADMNPSLTPCFARKASLISDRRAIKSPISHSWNVVSIAAVFCAPFSLSAMRSLILLIGTLFSPRASVPDAAGAAAAGLGGAGAAGAGGGGAFSSLGASLFGASFGVSAGGGGAPPSGAAPGFSVNRGAATSTVSPSAAACATTIPLSGEFTSTDTLSVSITATTSSFATKSPTCFFHTLMDPSVMESPIEGTGTTISAASLKNRRPVIAWT
mmetsp:Transcript_24555/g.48179  ORF Transcript_24555/g.48179 Transcript_24555/m.48179 type:complete len:237 (-) Transcript_24555:535-1245(-)